MAPAQSAGQGGESFQGLVLRYRGRTGLTQREVAQRLGAHVRSIQVWESGVSYPSSASLQALIASYLEAGGFEAGHEAAEAEALWAAALHEAPRLRPPFDAAWFAGLLARRGHESSAENVSALEPLHEDWGEAPDTLGFLGRASEVGVLQRWVIEEHCRVVALLGMGGIGKTTLAAGFARELAPAFERVYWRSVRNAPTLVDWLGGAIAFLSGQPLVPAEPELVRMTVLLELVRKQRCLLVLDNVETLLQPGLRESEYRAGYASYGRLLEVLAETHHQSCLVVTSREAPPELGLRAGELAAVRVMELGGLGIAEGQALLREKGLRGDPAAWESLVARYGGNSLALKMVGESIRQVFGGEIADFLGQVGFRTVFGSIRRLIDAHVERLSTLERDVLQYLTLDREPVTFAELVADLGPRAGPVEVLEAVEALRRRSLIERSELEATFTPQSVVLEYMTDQLVEQLADELARGRSTILVSYPLIKAQAKDYIRRGQERLLVMPLLERLIAACGGRQAAEQRLLSLLDELRERPMVEHGYAPGNLINLLRVLRGDLRGLDLSRLEIRQAFLQEVEAQDTTLAGSHLSQSVLAASFHYPACMALSADGSRLAAGTPTGAVCVWRVSDRKLLVPLQGHTGAVRGVALSEDGHLLASGSQDGTIRLWDAESGDPVLTLDDDVGVVGSVALSGDGTLLVSGSEDGTIRLWDPRGGRLVRTLPAHTGRVRGVAVSRDGRLLASGGSDGSVTLWEAATGRRLASLIEHGGEVWTVAVSANGRLAASGGLDGAVRVWDIVGVPQLTTLQAHTGGVWDVALSAEGALVVSGGVDGTVKVWDTLSGRQVATLHGHSAAVRGVALSGDAQLVASGNEDGTVRLWEAESGRLLATLQGHSGGVTSVALSPDGRVVARGSVDGTVRLWEVTTGHLLVTLTGHTAGVCAVALNTEAQLVVSGNADGTIKVWESATGRLLTTLAAHTDGVWGVALSGDGRLLASGSFDGTVKLWEAGTWRLINILEGHTGGVRSVALSHDGQLVAGGSVDGTVTVWEVCSGHMLTTVPGHTGGVRGVALDRDALLVASASAEGAVRLSDARTGRRLTGFQVDGGGMHDAALSGDGRLVASGCGDGTVRLWDTRTGHLRLTLQVDNVGVWSVALTDDGQLLASGSADGSVRVWDTSDGTCLRTLRADRHYERLDITGVTGLTDTQRAALLALGAVERAEQTPRPSPR